MTSNAINHRLAQKLQSLDLQGFRCADALAQGISARELRHGTFARFHHGMRSLPTDPDADPQLAAIAQIMRGLPSRFVLSHVSAWRVHGFVTPWPLDTDDRVHVSLPQGFTRTQLRTAHCHSRTHPIRIQPHHDFTITTPLQTWLDLAALKPPLDVLVACGDMAVGRDSDALAELRYAASTLPRTTGAPLARRAAKLLRCGAESIQETRARLKLAEAGDIPEPLLNATIHDAHGNFVARVDMLIDDVIVEYEGDHHRSDPAQWRKDIARQRTLEALGYKLVRITASDVNSASVQWIGHVRRALVRRRPPH